MKDVYSIFDKKTAGYGNLILAAHVGEVSRSIERAMEDEKSSLAMWPGDFSLVRLAAFDEATGKLTPIYPPEVIAEVASFRRAPKGGAQ